MFKRKIRGVFEKILQNNAADNTMLCNRTFSAGRDTKLSSWKGCIILVVIITKNTPFTKDEINKLRDVLDIYIKTVIDLKKRVCSAGSSIHADSEKILLDQGSLQQDIWGGGIELETKTIDFNSFINIRPSQKNMSNEIQDEKIRKTYEKLTRFFFQEIYE